MDNENAKTSKADDKEGKEKRRESELTFGSGAVSILEEYWLDMCTTASPTTGVGMEELDNMEESEQRYTTAHREIGTKTTF